MRRSLLAVLVLLVLPVPAAAEADGGLGVSLPLNQPLGPTLRARVDVDGSTPYSATSTPT